MSIRNLLSRWQADPSIGPNITSSRKIPGKEPSSFPIPDEVPPLIQDALRNIGINSLYSHQKQAWEAVQNGQHTAVVSSTASGKTLCYTLPVLSRATKNPGSRSLLLFPTKALARDQLNALRADFQAQAAAYDGDTPPHQRTDIRNNARIIITNPDMVHVGILPHHTNWESFFSQLDFVILDEIHTYRGVFGSHVANVLRRLIRIAHFYGSSPQFILTSATIGNPQQHAEILIGSPVHLIRPNFQYRGDKHFLFYNPPVVDHQLGIRAGMQSESIRLIQDILRHELQTIVFARSRKTVEHMVSKLKSSLPSFSNLISSYRSGYLPDERRNVEHRLRSQDLRAVVATTALELGIDIGGLDVSLLSGFPGTIASAWQQFGRAGRGDSPSLAILVTSSSPLDQYLANHPEYFYTAEVEQALINPDNLVILLHHLRCAAFEHSFQERETFGTVKPDIIEEILNYLTDNRQLHHSENTFYWMGTDYPAASLSLRTSSPQQIALRLINQPARESLLGTVDLKSATWMVHPGAVYLHTGDTYLVESLDLEKSTAYLRPANPGFYTEPIQETEIIPEGEISWTDILGGRIAQEEILVRSQVIGYKKIAWGRYEVLDRQALDLPDEELSTAGFLLSLSDEVEIKLRDQGIWSSSPGDYGPNWEQIRASVLTRDGYICQICGKTDQKTSLHVHHKKPLRSFPSYQEANHPDNLISLCPRCHQRVESVVRVKSGLNGLAYILNHLAPLLLMCDSQDLGVFADPAFPFADHRPTIVIFERVPAGLGFSRSIYERISELVAMSWDLIRSCPCATGCPSCVGPGGELGSGGKQEAGAILLELSKKGISEAVDSMDI